MAPDAVSTPLLLPDTTAGVREIVGGAFAAREPLRIQGAGTWRQAGPPVCSLRTLSLAGLAGIIEYVPGDLTLTAWSGTTLAELSHATAAHGQWLGLDPAGARHGTIGATIATASAGPLAHAFGTPRDLVLGLECVTGYGEVVHAGGRVVKNVAGFDLVRLNTGAWGTLGPVTALTLRLRAVPVHDVTLAIRVDGEAHLATLLAILRAPTMSFLAMEWVDGDTARRLGVGDGTDIVLVRLGGNDAFVRGQRAAIENAASCAPTDPAVWAALATRDALAAVVARFSGPVSGLPSRIGMLRALRSRCQGSIVLHATVGRGIVRLIADEAEAPVRDVLSATAADERVIVERQPDAWWDDAPDAFATGLAGRVRAAFDPAHICNRRQAAHA